MNHWYFFPTYGCLPGPGRHRETRSPQSLDPAKSLCNIPHRPFKWKKRERSKVSSLCETVQEELLNKEDKKVLPTLPQMDKPWFSWWPPPAVCRCPASSEWSPTSGCGTGASRWTSSAPRSGPASAGVKKLLFYSQVFLHDKDSSSVCLLLVCVMTRIPHRVKSWII